MRKFLSLVALIAAVAFVLSPMASAGDKPKMLKKAKVLYDGPHPTPDLKWCGDEGLHWHDFGPVKKAKFGTKNVRAYKFKGKVYWVCGTHPIDKKKLYEGTDRHMLLNRPFPFPRYQFDKEKDCYKFSEKLHWICGKHPIKGTTMYKKNDRHYVVADPPQWPGSYTEDGGNKCFRWKKPEVKLKVKEPAKLQIAPKKDDKEEKKEKKKDDKKKAKGLKEADSKSKPKDDKGKGKGKKKGLKVAK